jgi:hypothetical protein
MNYITKVVYDAIIGDSRLLRESQEELNRDKTPVHTNPFAPVDVYDTPAFKRWFIRKLAATIKLDTLEGMILFWFVQDMGSDGADVIQWKELVNAIKTHS